MRRQLSVSTYRPPSKVSDLSSWRESYEQTNHEAKVWGAKQDPVPAMHPAGEGESRVDRWAGCLIPPESARTMSAPDMDLPPSFLSMRAEDTGPTTTDVHRWANGTPQNSSRPFGAIALPPTRGIANVHAHASNQRTMGKRNAAPPDKVTGPQPPPKPNFGMRIGPHGEMNTQPEEVGVRRDPAEAEIMRLQNIAWEAIGTATVDGTERARYWHAWMMHCQLYKSVNINRN
jgi:hypothetical protein